MPRNITVTLADGTQHVYANAPDTITPDQVAARAQTDFGQAPKAIDGGRGAPPARTPAVPAGPPTAKNGFGLGAPPGPKGTPERDAYDAEYNKRFNTAYLAANPQEAQRRRIAASNQNHADVNAQNSGNFLTALKGGVTRYMFGVPERLAAAGERYLPSAITGNTTNASYDQILQTIRGNTDADMAQSTPGAIAGGAIGSVASGRAVTGVLAPLAARASAAASPILSRAGNVLESLMTLRKGQAVANAAKLSAGGAAAGGTQAVGEGSDPVRGAVTGAIAAPIVGGSLKLAGVLTRPVRDFLRTSSAGQILSRFTSTTADEITARAAAYRQATGAEPTVFELLPLADRNKILKQGITGRDNIVEQASNAIRARATNLGPEMSALADRTTLPQRRFATQGMTADLAQARGGVADPADAALAARAATSPTDMLALRGEEARAIMAPHDATPVADTFGDVLPQTPVQQGATVVMTDADPAVTAAIRASAPAGFRVADQGVTVGDISSMIRQLRGSLNKGGIEGGTAQRAIDHLEGVLQEQAPDAAAAHAQMTDAYAARSRMAEGMQEGNATRLRDDVQVGTSERQARTNRNAYDTPEGATGRVLGQSNRVLGDLAGSPEDALKATIKMARGTTGRALGENLGVPQAERLMAGARAQDASAQALSAASEKAQGGNGAGLDAEGLVQALVGLHPSSFATTKAGAIRKLLDMTYVPESRARTMVDMLFSQDPAMTRRAIDAIGNSPNGAKFNQYLAGLVGQTGADQPQFETDPNAPAPEAPEPETSAETAAEPGEEASAPTVDEASSPYAQNLQHIYDTESPDMLDLIGRVTHQESGGNQLDANGQPLTSSAGAVGAMQLMPTTAPEAARLAGVPFDEQAYRTDPAYNKVLGIAYLSELLRKYDGDVAKALAAYNAGPGRVDAAMKKHGDDWLNGVPAETQDYVQKIA